MPETQTDQPDGIALVEHCARYASEFGVDNMLDLIAGVHFAYAPLAQSVAVKAAYEIAGIDLDKVIPVQ